MSEAVEFLSPPKSVNRANYGGRTTGSIEWRTGRGESQGQKTSTPFVVEGDFSMSYCCATDTYKVNGKSVKGWSTHAFNTSEFFRKEEHDWKMVYIARNEGNTNEAEIEWKFNLPEKPIKSLKVFVSSEVFESGKIFWVRHSDSEMIWMPSSRAIFTLVFGHRTAFSPPGLRPNPLCGVRRSAPPLCSARRG